MCSKITPGVVYRSHEFSKIWEIDDSLFFDYGKKETIDILEISSLVGLHMNPYYWKETKTQEKCRALWGDFLYNEVMQIHEADERSSRKASNI